MRNVLPSQAGLLVSGVYYTYTTQKDPESDMLVHVQNENARGTGYIFRETDDWSGLSGNTISKSLDIAPIDISYWGRGSIKVEGEGTVTDASVIYGYQFDPCFDPQSNPNCPGYQDPFVIELTEVEVVDPLDDNLVQDELDRKSNLKSQEEDEKERSRKEKLEKLEKVDKQLEDLEVLLGTINTTELKAMAVLRHTQLQNLATIPTSYYGSIDGGTYPEALVLKDGKLPSNRRGLRQGMAQQLLHQELVNLQYAK